MTQALVILLYICLALWAVIYTVQWCMGLHGIQLKWGDVRNPRVIRLGRKKFWDLYDAENTSETFR